MSRRARIALKAFVWAACLTPLALLLSRAVTGDLGANPIETLTRTLGVWTLRLLLASLAMTPLRLLFGVAWPVTLRRLLGLFAFFYACLHFSIWIVLDHFFAWEEMLADVLKRPYITVGVLALTLLVPLAATSTARMIKRLGAANWKRLHRLVYVVGILGVLHFLWLAKVGRNDPYLYLGVLTLLLGIRLWNWLRRLAREGGRGAPRRRLEPSERHAVSPRQSPPSAAPSRDPSRV
ncbi:MAG: sulfoxide reductase heme-binding subunit YedZ [candidate division NC10 bacterium]|nr:sulfoxide reductase heme-binding subunit YedZ [candidate division NC10 bacterium]